MRVKFWGVRGDLPTPLTTPQLQAKLFAAISNIGTLNAQDPAAVQAYIASLPPQVGQVVGGNTPCVEIDTGTETIIIDCGSGMRELGDHLMTRAFGQGQGVAHIFLTHAHWDHLQGYPFFAPAYVPGNRLTFYTVNHDPQRHLEHQQTAPIYFSKPPNAMGAEKKYEKLKEGEPVQIGRLAVSNLALYHPGTAYAYRFDDGKNVFVFASDGEFMSASEASFQRHQKFFANADALVLDTQHALRDVNKGRSSIAIGLGFAAKAGVKRLITFHHDPTHSDEQIYNIVSAAREWVARNHAEVPLEVIVGHEGLELLLNT